MSINRLPTLGDKCRDKVTGFTGILTAIATHLTGCDRCWLMPVAAPGSDKLPDGAWIDIDMLEIVTPNVIDRVVYSRSAPGGADLPKSR